MNLLQPDYSLMLATLAIFVAPLAIFGWIAIRLLRGTKKSRQDHLDERERLVTLAERLEAVAEDTRRLDEAQRFTSAILAGRARTQSGDGKPAV